MNNTGNDGQATDPTKAYAVLYKAHQVHALAQLLIHRLHHSGIAGRQGAAPAAADQPAAAPPGAGSQATAQPVVRVSMPPLSYWYP